MFFLGHFFSFFSFLLPFIILFCVYNASPCLLNCLLVYLLLWFFLVCLFINFSQGSFFGLSISKRYVFVYLINHFFCCFFLFAPSFICLFVCFTLFLFVCLFASLVDCLWWSLLVVVFFLYVCFVFILWIVGLLVYMFYFSNCSFFCSFVYYLLCSFCPLCLCTKLIPLFLV